MNELVVISGKGGTGKTSISGSFAVLAPNKVVADCDVDAANLHLLLAPEIKERHDFYGLPKAQIDPDQCSGCGLCEENCRFGAIRNRQVNPINCEGCAVCSHLCPEGAIKMVDARAGQWFKSETTYGPLVHARLGIAQENSGKLVTEVRRQARQVAGEKGCDLIITDGPPGIGCPVIASLGGASLALIVTEPTLPGIHDTGRTIDLAEFFNIPAMVCVNKWDINPDNTREIIQMCQKRKIPYAGSISYDSSVVYAASSGRPVLEMNSGVVDEIIELWNTVYKTLYTESK